MRSPELSLATLASLLLLAPACRGNDNLDVPVYDDGSLECADAPVLGAAGETRIETMAFTWFEGSDAWYAAPMVVQVPPDLTSLQVSVVDGPHWTGIAQARHNGALLIDGANDFYGAPYYHYPYVGGSTIFPINEDSALDEGCLELLPVSFTDPGPEGELYLASRRTAPGTRFKLELIVVGATAVGMDTLEAAVAAADQLYAAAGSPTFESVSYTALDWERTIFDLPSEDPSGSFDQLGQLLSSHTPTDPLNFNVFVIQDFSETGYYGVAAGIPGPNGIPGTGASGLVVSVDTHLDSDLNINSQLLGETIAHEIGHQLGLFHTSEAEGDAHDVIADTPECDAATRDLDGDGQVTPEECLEHGGDNVMFWTGDGSQSQTRLSPTQIELLSLSPIAN